MNTCQVDSTKQDGIIEVKSVQLPSFLIQNINKFFLF